MKMNTINAIAIEIANHLFEWLPDEIEWHRNEKFKRDFTEQESDELEHKIYYEIHKRCHEFARERNGRKPR